MPTPPMSERPSALPEGSPDSMSVLCLDGGGYLGLATASFLAESERHFNARCADRFNLFCGTSTGGIIALALASGKPASEVVDLYKALGKQVFGNRYPFARAWRAVRSLFVSRYGNVALRGALKDVFGDLRLGDLRARGRYIVVPAFSLTSGGPRVFKTNHCAELTAHDDYLVRDVALATSAAPTFFPIASIRSPSGAMERFVDGGVYANNPTLLGFTEAVSYLGVPLDRIRLLSVSTPRLDRAESVTVGWLERWRLRRGLLGYGSGLADLFVDSTMQMTHTAMTRILHHSSARIECYHRVTLPGRAGLALDVATDGATETLTTLGSNRASEASERNRLRPFFQHEGA